MCEFTSSNKKTEAIRFFQKHGTHGYVLPDFHNRFKLPIQAATCPICGRHLSEEDMRPPGRATRCMCVPCYEHLVPNNLKANCFLCKDPLPRSRVLNQIEERREIRFHMHNQPCEHLWTMVHNTVLGEYAIHRALGVPAQTPLVEQEHVYKGKPVRLITF